MDPKHSGFTLLEMMVAITIAGVLLGIGIPSFVSTIRANRLATITNEMIGALMFARSEAIKRNVPVAVCRSNNGSSCVTGDGKGWEVGWITYVDTDRNSALTVGESIIDVHEAMNASISAIGNNNLANQILYSSLGLMPARMGTINVKFFDDTTNSNIRTICVGSSGRARLMPKGTTCAN